MSKPVSKKAIVRLISFTLTAVLLLGGAGITGYNLISRYQNTIEYTYQSALNEFSDYITELKNTLSKSIYANTTALRSDIYTKLMLNSQGAKSALGRLPVSIENEQALQKYLSQVGDFASAMQRKYLSGAVLSEEEINSFIYLRDYCNGIAESIEELASAYGDGSADLGNGLIKDGNLNTILKADQVNLLDDGFRSIDDSFMEYPTMIYDGPFSDHLLTKKALLTENSEELSQEDALYNASVFLNCDKSELNLRSQTRGNLPLYCFSGEDMYISVTVQGGYIETMHKYREIGDIVLDYEDALEKAEYFLKEKKLYNMDESYGVISNGICTFNFAYEIDGITCYSDLIKVGVALDNGEIVSYSATGYIMNHKEREVPTAGISLRQASERLSNNLKIQEDNMAFIPTGGQNEVFCYEFLCSGEDDDKLLVYINASTGMEEHIYILLENENGVLAI